MAASTPAQAPAWLWAPWRWLAPYRLRILFRAAFLLLAVATVGLAVTVLQQEKQLSYKSYQAGFQKTRQQIAATLRHPSGQLALLNPPPAPAATPSAALRPLLLPFSALDFDDQNKVQQAVAMSGCLVQYGSRGALCAGIGNNPWAGGYLYLAGNFDSATLVEHARGAVLGNEAHRVLVEVESGGQHYRWIAPFEIVEDAAMPKSRKIGLRGRLTGFNAADIGRTNAHPLREFRGWIWQNAHCSQAGVDDATPECSKSSFFSLRLPVPAWQEALFGQKAPVWPPADLQQMRLRVRVYAPGDDAPLLDSESGASGAPFSLNDLQALLQPGESLVIRRAGRQDSKPLVQLDGKSESEDESWSLLTRLIRHLPVDAYDAPLSSRDDIATLAGDYSVELKGDVRSVARSLSVVATRASWFVGAMLLALLLVWWALEVGIMRRIALLTRRADTVSRSVKGTGALDSFNLADLRGSDELGILAGCLQDLLRRVREDVEREGIRTAQEKDMWHAVGHEIMSPLQSLLALQGSDGPGSRYINRMQQAIRVLYGSASPSEAFQATVLQMEALDLDAFLQNIAANAPCVGIEQVAYYGPGKPMMVRADEYPLEDVVTHVLRNAQRYRLPGTAIVLELSVSETNASVSIRNQGPQIASELIDKIFEYGVSDQADSGAHGNRGQGLFVARTYMAKMGGTIVAANLGSGVEFCLSLQLAF